MPHKKPARSPGQWYYMYIVCDEHGRAATVVATKLTWWRRLWQWFRAHVLRRRKWHYIGKPEDGRWTEKVNDAD